MAFPEAWMAELLQKNEIASVLSEYMELKPKGRKLWGLCPLHGEKTASFSVSTDKQLFYCFGCHAGGTVIQFIMSIERLTYGEAVQFLASRVGMELPRDVDDQKLREQRAYRERLYQATKAAARFFCERFLSPEGESARAYAARRGFSREIVLRYGIGYAPEGWDNLKNALTKAGFSEKELTDAGLLVRNPERGTVYDAYRNRLIFPIQDTSGHVLGFGARAMNDEDKPKYLNTGDTPIYSKRKNVYGLQLQKSRKLADLIMVEGYVDVIGLYRAGVDNAVASLGTALTPQQARLIKRYVETVYIAYDGDAAGQTANIRGMEILAAEGLNVRVIVLPDGLDPDEYVQVHGRDGFDRLKDNALTLSAFRLEAMAGEFDLSAENGREQYAVKACAHVATLQPVEQERYLKQIGKKTGYDLDSLRQQVKRGASYTDAAPRSFTRGGIRRRAEAADDQERMLERTLLAAALQSPQTLRLADEAGVRALIQTPAYARLLDTALEKGAAFDQTAYAAAETDDADLLGALFAIEPSEKPDKAIADCIAKLKKRQREEELAAMQAELTRTDLTDAQKAEAMKRIQNLIRASK